MLSISGHLGHAASYRMFQTPRPNRTSSPVTNHRFAMSSWTNTCSPQLKTANVFYCFFCEASGIWFRGTKNHALRLLRISRIHDQPWHTNISSVNVQPLRHGPLIFRSLEGPDDPTMEVSPIHIWYAISFIILSFHIYSFFVISIWYLWNIYRIKIYTILYSIAGKTVGISASNGPSRLLPTAPQGEPLVLLGTEHSFDEATGLVELGGLGCQLKQPMGDEPDEHRGNYQYMNLWENHGNPIDVHQRWSDYDKELRVMMTFSCITV